MFKKRLDSEEIARNVHDWLRAEGVLDEDHDLPFAATPAQYRAKLEDVVSGAFRKRAAAAPEPSSNVVRGEFG